MIRKPGVGKICDFVWVDEDCDGVQDIDEEGLGGVTVTLTGMNQSGVSVNLTTTTNANGYYEFENIEAGGAYKVTFSLPAGYRTTHHPTKATICWIG
ncbi:MAG: SdrD B-like domain-containing protein [Saprospiraceae bacterium]